MKIAQKDPYEIIPLIIETIDPRYLAGVIDSDGSISIAKKDNHGYREYRPTIQITWKNIQLCSNILGQLKAEYGGSLFVEKSRRELSTNTYLAYKVDSRGLEMMLDNITEFLIIKRKQADICVEVRKLKRPRGYNNRYHPRSDNDIKKLDDLYEECKALNHKGSEGVI